MVSARQEQRAPLLVFTAAIVALMGLALLAGGVWLAVLGGSPYYVIAGAALLVTAWLLWQRHAAALWVYAALLLGTMAWALWEVGLDFWSLAPRGDVLAPLGIWLLLDTLPWRMPAKNYAALGCLVLLLVTLRPGNWGRISWGDDYFGVKPPALADPARTMVLMTGVDPMAYVIPFFPEPVRFLRIQSYFTGPSDTPNGSDRLMQRLIAEHRGPLFVLYRIYEEKQCRNALQGYGLTMDSNDCRAFTPHIIEEYQQFPLMFCAVARTDTFNNNQ